jgi:sterol desaturase/sphingolipid hydroxylase (fatty acid hydroxylase superfamily)
MDARAIALSVPLFFLLIALELYVTRRRHQRAFALHDSIASLSCGVGQQAIALVTAAAKAGGYALVFARFHLLEISPRSPLAWLALLLGTDLAYYAYHRASHRVNFLWATHAVHHQSEEYNLTTALRQSWFTGFTAWIFYLPLAIIGFPTAMFVAMYTLITLYQFWIHTRAVDRIGLFEAFLNTPSHHRVHHGIDPAYIDRNYAGVFIVWDRLFGTFEPERREPVYGTVKPLASFNPFRANVEPWAQLFALARQTRRLRDRVWLFLAPPEWRPADLGGTVVIPGVSRGSQRKFEAVAPRGLDAYLVVTFALVVIGTTALLGFEEQLGSTGEILAAAAILVGVVTPGALVEARRWAVPLEWIRLAALVPLAAWLARGSAHALVIAAIVGAGALGLAIWVGRYRSRRPEEAIDLDLDRALATASTTGPTMDPSSTTAPHGVSDAPAAIT